MAEYTDQNGVWEKGDKIDKLIIPTSEFIERKRNSFLIKREEGKRQHIKKECGKLLADCNVNICNAEHWELLNETEKSAWRNYKLLLKSTIDNIDTVNVDTFQYPEKP